jgi:hypothetical protein
MMLPMSTWMHSRPSRRERRSLLVFKRLGKICKDYIIFYIPFLDLEAALFAPLLLKQVHDYERLTLARSIKINLFSI